MIVWFLKRFIISKINAFLGNYKDDVQKTRQNVDNIIKKIDTFRNIITSLSEKLDDNNLSEEEIDDIMKQIDDVIKNW